MGDAARRALGMAMRGSDLMWDRHSGGCGGGVCGHWTREPLLFACGGLLWLWCLKSV